MSLVVDALQRHAQRAPQRIALEDGTRALTYAQLALAVDRAARQLRELARDGRPVAIYADNGSAWAIADLAALAAHVPVVPLPLFFSAAQIAHALRAAGAGCVLTDRPEPLGSLLGVEPGVAREFGDGLCSVRVPAGDRAALADDAWKITFTSGTTGEPKGVCLARDDLERTAQALCAATAASADDRHLCVLPLPTLLENLGGIYVPLLAGATASALPLAGVGLSGSSGLDVRRFAATLQERRPTSAILVPQILQALVGALRAGLPAPRSLRYVAVGGAPVATNLLNAAADRGLPVFEGYGLSECGSVVAVNRPGAQRTGSVGRPLPHLAVTIAADGEILVGGSGWRGYLGDPVQGGRAAAIRTGDLGHVDDDGYLHVTGRRKNLFITSYGRNVAPEWVERELVSRPPILQAAVFGEARPFNTAVVVAAPSAARGDVDAALCEANRQLPDYAQAHAWIAASAPFTAANGLATANGRLRRDAIFGCYAAQIDAMYHPRQRTGVR